MGIPITKLGIIGGTGLYELEGLKETEQIDINTPFGAPSSKITKGKLENCELYFIARHGEGHRYLPTEVPFKANIYALKMLGVEWCLGVGAVGSLREQCEPRDLMVPNQVIDRTKFREQTFFGNGVVAHVNFADPFCNQLRNALIQAGKAAISKSDKKIRLHEEGTYLCIEGPAFSTRAESEMYRELSGSIIGMTIIPESKLAREAEIAYASLSLITDYDCWRSTDDDVDINEILAILKENSEVAKQTITELARILPEVSPTPEVAAALKYAIVTNHKVIPNTVKESLAAILSKYLD